MGVYSNLISVMDNELKKKTGYEGMLQKEQAHRAVLIGKQNTVDEAFKLLSTISDKQLNTLLDSVEALINRVLQDIFSTEDPRIISINKTMLKSTTPQLKINLENGKGNKIDLQLQEGMGLKQIVSVVFSIFVVAQREDRPIIILDECLSGLHNLSKRYMEELLNLMTQEGFQFILVEYNCDTLGKIYNMEKRAGITSIVPVNGKYDPNMKYLSDMDLDIADLEEVADEDENDDADF